MIFLAKTLPAKDGPGQAVPGLGNEHIEHISLAHSEYNSNPPTSGPHVAYKVSWGVHATPVAPEVQVRHLEEGGVLMQYNCPQGCPDLIQKLEVLAGEYRPVLLAPNPLLSSRLALTAWERIDNMAEFDEKRVRAFISSYLAKPHFPETGEDASSGE